MAYAPIASSSAVLSVSTSSVGLSSPPDAATKARVQVLTANIRFWVDGSTPTASQGVQAGPGHVIILYRTEIDNFKAIREGGTDSSLQVSYFAGSYEKDIDWEEAR